MKNLFCFYFFFCRLYNRMQLRFGKRLDKIRLFWQNFSFIVYVYAIFFRPFFPGFTKCTIRKKNTRYPPFPQGYQHSTCLSTAPFPPDASGRWTENDRKSVKPAFLADSFQKFSTFARLKVWTACFLNRHKILCPGVKSTPDRPGAGLEKVTETTGCFCKITTKSQKTVADFA